MTESNTAVAAATGLSRFALARHRKHMNAAMSAAYFAAPPEERWPTALICKQKCAYYIDEANQLRATAVRERDVRTALKGIDTALKALEMFAKLSGQLQGPQHKHLHLHAEVPSREEAIDLYSRSIEAFPTAEAYTFRGWTYSFLGQLDKAISECLEAIRVDPGFGNPYNDIGAYLIEQGNWHEAIPWLEKATRAPRYEAYCYPWFNMGRVHEHLHNWQRALECYRKAFEANRQYRVALVGYRRLQAMWN